MKLYPYQEKAVNWMEEKEKAGRGGILALDMGLGTVFIFLLLRKVHNADLYIGDIQAAFCKIRLEDLEQVCPFWYKT